MSFGWQDYFTGANDSSPWYNNPPVRDLATGGSRLGLFGATGVEPAFSGGMYLGIMAAANFGGTALGLRFNYREHQEDAQAYFADAQFESYGMHAFLRGYFNPFGSAPHMQWWLEPEFVYQHFNAFIVNSAIGFPDESVGMDQLGVGLRLGTDVTIVEGLRLGAFFGAELTAVVGIQMSNAFIESGSYAEPMVGYATGLTLAYILPISGYRPQPLPPPPPPQAVEPVHVLVTSEQAANVTERDEAEVVETPDYRASRNQWTTVAVAAPDRCADQTLSEATGQGASSGEVLATQCGVEMGEIERALTLLGYRVISWRILARQTGMPSERARALGAEILFQVNSLERSLNMPGMVAAARERRFFVSDAYGTQGLPAALPEPDAAILDQIIAQAESNMDAGTRPGAGLDINAVSVETGQTIWLYRWRRLLRGQGHDRAEALVRGHPLVRAVSPGEPMYVYPGPMGEFYQWGQVPPLPRPGTATVQPVQTQLRTGSTQSSTTATGATDRLQGELFDLLRSIISHSVNRFRCGPGGDPSVSQCTTNP